MNDSGRIFLDRIRLAVKESAFEVQEEARANHLFKTRTGALERSIEVDFNNGGTEGVVYLDTAVARYGPFVHEGTKPHLILPRNRKVLRWSVNGRFIFSKKARHPGTKKDQFLYKALYRKREDIKNIFLQHTNSALEEVAAHVFSRRPNQ